MGLRRSKSLVCPVDQHCSQWAEKLMGYCLCGKRDLLSLSLGLISVVSWGVAEVPQLITNYRSKSAEGLSIMFLLTWIVGDFLNLFGCILEPATLPTQYYTAVLYTVTTFILFSQAVYYRHIYPQQKSSQHQEAARGVSEERRMGLNCEDDTKKSYSVDTTGLAPSLPIPIATISPNRSGELFFMSARSLSVCHTRTFLASRTLAPEVEPGLLKEPLLGEIRSSQSAPPSKIKTMLCVISLFTLILGTRNQKLMENRKNDKIYNGPTGATVLRVGRQLFEAKTEGRSSTRETVPAESNGIGTCFGWGGRLPQIRLNFQWGNVEGLNPLMFIFALVGNLTYVASILVTSLKWSKIQPNLPWLVESGGCVLLDIFILIQFFYYRCRSRSRAEKYVS